MIFFSWFGAVTHPELDLDYGDHNLDP
jgi:hypothetical protein